MNENKEKMTYEDVLKPVETLNDSNIIFKQWTDVYKMSDDKCKKTAEEILLQPYMKQAYSAHNIEPQDVKEFIETVTQNRTVCENIILNNSNIFQQNKENSKDKNGDGKSDGDNTKIDTEEEKLVRKIQLIGAFEKIMKSFAEQKDAERNKSPDKPWYTKALLKSVKIVDSAIHKFAIAGGIAILAMGSYVGIKAYAENDKDNMFGISPTDNSKALQNVRSKVTDEKTKYDAFSKADKKVNKNMGNPRKNSGIEMS